jgi:putative hemin transport protein
MDAIGKEETGMAIATNQPTIDVPLRVRVAALRAERPGIRARDAAAALGTSEAELVAAGCGGTAERLAGPWHELIGALPSLGPVMALTRNEYAVHEKTGRYDKISFSGTHGLALDRDIDLRLFLDHWHHGFAVTEETRSGLRRSLQFFDADGTAVHKIYLIAESDAQAYATLLGRHRNDDQAPQLTIRPKAPAPRAAAFADAETLHKRWDALQDTHDFYPMLRDLALDRIAAFRLVEGRYTERATTGSFRRALEMAAADQAPVMVFVGSPGVIQIHTGPVATLKEVGPWFNVLDKGFNLHLRQDGIAGAWIVRKPTRDGIVTSLEIFDAQDNQIAWLFGQRKPGEPERSDWRALVERLPRVEG